MSSSFLAACFGGEIRALRLRCQTPLLGSYRRSFWHDPDLVLLGFNLLPLH